MSRRVFSSGPLSGIKVLDFSRVLAGPYCSQMLGDMGAEVIKVESLHGDDTRRWGPPFTPKGEESAYFISLNRNKLGITVNMKHSASEEIIDKLVCRSDVLIENFITGTAEKLGIGYDKVSKLNESLVYCSLTGFGSTGPLANRPGYDAICSAMYGMMHITGDRGGGPVKPGVAVTDVLAGLLAHGAILAALFERSKSGLGQRIDTSLMEAQLSSLVYVANNYLITGYDSSERLGTAHPSIVPYQAFKCMCGRYISIAIGNDSQFRKFCKAIGRESLADDTKFSTNKDRVLNRDEIIHLLEDVFLSKTVDYWLEAFENKGFPFGLVRNVEESFRCSQAQERKMEQEIDHPTCGKVKLVGLPVKYSRTPSSIRLPPPVLGEHTRYVLMDLLGYDEEKVLELVETGAISIHRDENRNA